MADHVRRAVLGLSPSGRVVDLFSGMGSVAESLSDTVSVVTNDALSFTAAVSRARFTGVARDTSPAGAVARVAAAFVSRRNELSAKYWEQLEAESSALSNREDLSTYMAAALHVGNSPTSAVAARRAAESSGSAHYELATLYFSAGYLGLAQAIEVDALRWAIDSDTVATERDWLLAGWLAACSILVNAPGHTAQFLKPTTDAAAARIIRTWRRSVWDEFEGALASVRQVGSDSWRAENEVRTGDALDLVAGGGLREVGAIYADPPYTKDQYSRYYHMYETLYRYDYPSSSGAGRNRSDRFTTGFSLRSEVVASFHDLCRHVSRMQVPLILSYPSNGLLLEAGYEFPAIARLYFASLDTVSLDRDHSTMGGSSGSSKKKAIENLYVCTN